MLPGVIRSEKENERALAIVASLMKRGENDLSPEEDKLLDLLTTLIEDFEEKAYPMGNVSNPQVAVRELMPEHAPKQTGLVDIFGSQGVVSQVPGRQTPDKQGPKLPSCLRRGGGVSPTGWWERLSERFRLPIDIFI